MSDMSCTILPQTTQVGTGGRFQTFIILYTLAKRFFQTQPHRNPQPRVTKRRIMDNLCWVPGKTTWSLLSYVPRGLGTHASWCNNKNNWCRDLCRPAAWSYRAGRLYTSISGNTITSQQQSLSYSSAMPFFYCHGASSAPFSNPHFISLLSIYRAFLERSHSGGVVLALNIQLNGACLSFSSDPSLGGGVQFAVVKRLRYFFFFLQGCHHSISPYKNLLRWRKSPVIFLFIILCPGLLTTELEMTNILSAFSSMCIFFFSFWK